MVLSRPASSPTLQLLLLIMASFTAPANAWEVFKHQFKLPCYRKDFREPAGQFDAFNEWGDDADARSDEGAAECVLTEETNNEEEEALPCRDSTRISFGG